MSETIFTFERCEKKYMLTAGQFEALWPRLSPHLRPDEYPESTVCSIYYDTDDYRLIRHSIDAPVYKEKLRLRSYGVPGPEGAVFVELKKKFKGIVYKRRVTLSAREATDWLAGRGSPAEDSQTTREIDWLLQRLQPRPRVCLCCDRSAYRDIDDPALRITFDRDIRWRCSELDITAGDRGERLLPEGRVLMEIKLSDAAPLWLARLLSEERIFPTSFSKYGTCYKEHILNEYILGGPIHA